MRIKERMLEGVSIKRKKRDGKNHARLDAATKLNNIQLNKIKGKQKKLYVL